MNKALYPIFVILMLFVFPKINYATHIVGGEMNYRCLGNNQYEIQLTVFRDCDTGIPDFDDPASIGIFAFDPISNSYYLDTSVGDNGQPRGVKRKLDPVNEKVRAEAFILGQVSAQVHCKQLYC